MDDFSVYQSMKKRGCTADEVFQQAVRDGIDAIAVVRMLRAVFDLSLGDVKDIRHRAMGGSAEDHESALAEEIKKIRERDG